MLDYTSTQQSKFRTKNGFQINDGSRETYNTNTQIKCKTSMLKSNLYNNSNAYILVKGTITITEGERESRRCSSKTRRQGDKQNKQVIF